MNKLFDNVCNILNEIKNYINEDNYDLPNESMNKIN